MSPLISIILSNNYISFFYYYHYLHHATQFARQFSRSQALTMEWLCRQIGWPFKPPQVHLAFIWHKDYRAHFIENLSHGLKHCNEITCEIKKAVFVSKIYFS